ncbi:MAG: PxxKW family cysteine-rich protein [Desulfobacterales bacterium]|nr:PxxKW family cysteine-rich protein [Desulfobacterales bacterium]
MLCTTVRKDNECSFMTAKGCSYKEGSCFPIVDDCNGCNRVIEFSGQKYCSACPEPASKWKKDKCNLATHIAAVAAKEAGKKVNPLKASKRASKGKK